MQMRIMTKIMRQMGDDEEEDAEDEKEDED